MAFDPSTSVGRTPTAPMTAYTPSDTRQIRTLPHRTKPGPHRSAPLALHGDEWRPTSSSNAPATEVAEAQTLAEFSRLNLVTPNDQKSKVRHGRAEETLISLAGHAPKREFEPGPPEERPTKKRRGLASTLVDGAVSVASSWWNSWGYEGEPAGAEEYQTSSIRFVPDPAYAPSGSSTPSRATFPPRTVYLSNRRKRAMVSTPRRRAAPGHRSGYSTPQGANTINVSKPPPTPLRPRTNTVRIGSHGTSHDENVDPDDDAFNRMQSRLDSMITQCRTALSSHPDPEELMSHLAQDATASPHPSSPTETPRTQSFLHLSSTTLPHTSITPTPPLRGAGRSTPSNGPPSRASRLPSRIPVPIRDSSSPRPPTASTFAFRMRSSSRTLFDAGGPNAPSNVSRPPSTTPPRPPRAGSSGASRLSQRSSVPIFDTAFRTASPTPSLLARRFLAQTGDSARPLRQVQ